MIDMTYPIIKIKISNKLGCRSDTIDKPRTARCTVYAFIGESALKSWTLCPRQHHCIYYYTTCELNSDFEVILFQTYVQLMRSTPAVFIVQSETFKREQLLSLLFQNSRQT